MIIHKVRAETIIYPTEDEKKVRAAIENIIALKQFAEEEQELGKLLFVETTEGKIILSKLHKLMRTQRILDTAREFMKKYQLNNEITLKLNKQAALMGVVSFTEGETSLGPIVIKITTSKPEQVIDWLAPKTKDGKPLYEIELEG